MNLLILGPQGSGKGTQAQLLAKKFSLLYLEMGSLLRQLSKTDKEIDRTINKGQLLPDGPTVEIFAKFLADNSWEKKNGLMLDGFPRTFSQHQSVKEYLSKYRQKIDHAIYLDISESTSIKRLSARRTCSGCGKVYNLLTNPPKGDVCGSCGGKLVQREDDKEEAIRERLRIFREMTQPLIELLEKEGILLKIDGERPIQTIFEDICNRLI